MHPAHGSDANPNTAATPAGWYADPSGAPQQRYWDGAGWTAHAAAPPPGAGAHRQGGSDRSWIPWTIAAVAVVIALIALLVAWGMRPSRQGQPGQPGQTSRHSAMVIAPDNSVTPGLGRLY